MENIPLGLKYNSYELTGAINDYLLSPYQYSGNIPQYNLPKKEIPGIN